MLDSERGAAFMSLGQFQKQQVRAGAQTAASLYKTKLPCGAGVQVQRKQSWHGMMATGPDRTPSCLLPVQEPTRACAPAMLAPLLAALHRSLNWLQEDAGVRAARAEAELRSVQERLEEEQAACSALKKQMGGWPLGGQQAATAAGRRQMYMLEAAAP